MIAIYWNSGPWKGYTDLLPSWWFEDDGEHPSRLYDVQGPREGRLPAKCSVSVRGNIADLNYGGDHTAFNERQFLIGTMRLIFDSALRTRVNEVQWRYAEPVTEFVVADVEVGKPTPPPPSGPVDQNPKDARKRIDQTIVQRQGQPAFRNALMDAYERRCAITGCDVGDVLEAAHISPYLGEHTNRVTNGLLLRADIHTLFDRGLIKVSREYKVMADASVRAAYDLPKSIRLPNDAELHPSQDALHRKWQG
jgi:hypothetical protein